MDLWWRAAMLVAFVMASVGGAMMLYDTPLSIWALGLKLLIVGVLGLVISTIGAWITRNRR